ncbi:MAG: uncharacterized Zn finger protein (UPF0148 family) [Natronomonas sp.]|jgi:uncharacterized Zn finger protein (UPF0148 family)
MSDFDKEAERERLRKKYEQDQQDRQATEKMSELLLQGATMTNAHCSDCGDPVFRYEGQAFCATCEKAVDRDDGADSPAPDGSEDTGAGAAANDNGTDSAGEVPEDAERIHVASPDETRVQFGDDGETAGSAPSRADQTADEPEPAAGREPGDRPTQQPTETAGSQPEPAPGVDPSPARSATGSPDRDAGAGADHSAGTVSEARASLERTLAGLTRRAAAAEDPTQAREYLAAAREAAETLAALRQ